LEEHAEKLFSIRFFNNYLNNYLKTFVQPLTNGFLEWGAEGPRQPKVYATYQPKTFSDFLFIWFILFSLCFLEQHAEKLFSIRFFNNYLKTFVQPISQNIFQIFFLFGSFFFSLCFLEEHAEKLFSNNYLDNYLKTFVQPLTNGF